MLNRLDEETQADDCTAAGKTGRAGLPREVPCSASMRAGEASATVVNSPVERTTILLVEADSRSTISIEQALLQLGFGVLVARSLSVVHRLLRDPNVRIDVVLLDGNLPGGRTRELLADLEEAPREPGLVVLHDRADVFCPETVMSRAVVVPVTTPAQALGNILEAAAGGCVAYTLRRFSRRYKLSRKEAATLSRLAEGVSPKAIAAEANCSLQAVYAQLARICTRTSCRSYTEVVAKLFQFSCHGLGHEMGKTA